jgi:hypothetical protein
MKITFTPTVEPSMEIDHHILKEPEHLLTLLHQLLQAGMLLWPEDIGPYFLAVVDEVTNTDESMH